MIGRCNKCENIVNIDDEDYRCSYCGTALTGESLDKAIFEKIKSLELDNNG